VPNNQSYFILYNNAKRVDNGWSVCDVCVCVCVCACAVGAGGQLTFYKNIIKYIFSIGIQNFVFYNLT